MKLTGAILLCALAAPEDPALTAYALSYRPIDAALRAEIVKVADALGAAHAARRDAAQRRLLAYGEPAYRVLVSLDPTDPEVRQRVAAIVDRLRALRTQVMRARLHRDVAGLVELGAPGRARLARILPEPALAGDPSDWWARERPNFRWDPVGDRYIRWGEWSGTPLRFKKLGHVEIVDSERLLDLNAEFTIEMWVRWPSTERGWQYLAGNEGWPGMHARLPVDRTVGWVLRRHTRDGMGRIEFCVAVEGGNWWGELSDPLPTGDAWEHIAVNKSRSSVRVYRNGEMITERRCAGRLFVHSPTPIYLGPRRFAWPDRAGSQDVRAFRLSNRARYPKEFTAPQRFTRDADTLVLYDFADGAGELLSDRSGQGRNGRLRGPAWLHRIQPAAVARALKALGITADTISVFEAEWARHSEHWRGVERTGMSDGTALDIRTSEEPDGRDGHWLALRFSVPRAGRYRVFFSGGAMVEFLKTSPFCWWVDEGEPHVVSHDPPTLLGIRGAEAGLSALGAVTLTAGEHTFRLKLTGRRAQPDRSYLLTFDALVLQHLR